MPQTADISLSLSRGVFEDVADTFDFPLAIIDEKASYLASASIVGLTEAAQVQELAEETEKAFLDNTVFPDISGDELSDQLSQDIDEFLSSELIEQYVEILKTRQSKDTKSSAPEERLLVEFYEDAIPNATVPVGEKSKKIVDLVADDFGDDEKGIGDIFRKVRNAIVGAGKAIAGKVKRLIKKLISFEVVSTKVEILRKPEFVLGNPISTRKLFIHFRAVIRICVRIIRRKCKDFAVNLQFEVGSLRLNLSVVGKKVVARPTFKDFDLVLTFSLFGIKVKIKIGLTGIVNGKIKNVVIPVLDLSALEKTFEKASRPLQVTHIDISADGSAVIVGASTSGVGL